MTEISLKTPLGNFFGEHVYDSYDPGDIGVLYELQKVDGATANLRGFSQKEFDLLTCAN